MQKWNDLTGDDKIIAEINKKRRQILVHSCLYYQLDDNLISDQIWSKIALELFELQNKYPKLANQCCYARDFKDFDYSTGANLPFTNPEIRNIAMRLLRYRDLSIRKR